jgi:cysteine desulfurase
VGGWLHCDATQAAGRIPLPEADLLTVSAHKLGGPQGIGALINRTGLTLDPLLKGGGQELGARAGIQSPALAAGFAAAAQVPMPDTVLGLRDQLEAALGALGGEVIAQQAARLPNTTAVRMPSARAETQVMAFDLAGFAVSAGSACSSGKVSVSPVLLAMRLDPTAAAEVIRISLGWATQPAEIDAFAQAWRKVRDQFSARRSAAA